MRWIVLILAVTPILAWGDIYKWVDEDGNVHFSDSPQGKQAVTVNLRTVPAGDDASRTTLTDREAADRLRRDRLAREARSSIRANLERPASRDCVKARDTLALKQAQWERRSRRGYRQSDKIHYENLIADWQLRVQQKCS